MTDAQSILEILLRTKKEGDGEKQATQGMTNMNDAFKKLTGVSLGWAGAAALAVGAAVAIGKELAKAEKAAVESAKADARLEAVLNSTGGAVGLTSKQLSDMAGNLSLVTGLDDDLIKSAEAVMLTFTGVGRVTFPTAMKAAADLSVILGTDLNGSVVQIGKAMNDFTGYTALKRAGVSFSEEQIKQIDNFKATNDLVGYQNLILKELQKEFGGSAKAVNEAGDGTENMKVAVGNLQETIGAKMIPVQRWWNKLLEDAANGLNGAIIEADNYQSSIEKLGISYGPVSRGQQVVYAYMRNGVELTKQQVDALVNGERANQAWADNLNAMAAAYKKVNPEMELTAEQMEAITKANQEEINQIGAFQSMYESYSKSILDLVGEQTTVEKDLAAARKAGYGESSEKVQGYITKLGEIRTKIGEVERAHDIETKKVILGYMQQKLAADGVLTDDEQRWLIEKGVEWGVYEAGAIGAYNNATAAADIFLEHRNTAEADRVIHVSIVYDQSNPPIYTPGPGSEWKPMAAGGPAEAGQPYYVGEAGPELFIPNQSGMIIPNSQSFGNVYITVSGAAGPADTAREIKHQLDLQMRRSS